MDSQAELLRLQSGVISRRQLLALAGDVRTATTDAKVDIEIARRLRRRDWVVVHDGVYVDHTGELTWMQRGWAAVLYAWPAALSHDSALRAAEGPGRRHEETTVIHVAVQRERHVATQPGLRVHRVPDLDDRVQWNRSPPRVRYEEAALDVASRTTDDVAAVSVLARAVQSRCTTAHRMIESLGKRRRIARRAWMHGVLTDVAEGTCSVLEHGYLTLVERPHGLPVAERQRSDRGRGGRIYRDASYTEPLEVELDGRLGHSSTREREADYDRDLVTLVDGRVTARLSYGQVFARSCWTAAQIDHLLRQRGCLTAAVTCGPTCPVSA